MAQLEKRLWWVVSWVFLLLGAYAKNNNDSTTMIYALLVAIITSQWAILERPTEMG